MKHSTPFRIASHVVILLVIAICGAYLFQRVGLVASVSYAVPSSIPSDCSTDDSTSLTNWFASLPPNATVTFPANGCYLVQTKVHIASTNGLTINGNGATFKRTDPTEMAAGGILPLLMLTQDINMSINGLTLDGGYNGTTGGGAGHEGHYGIFMECNHGLTLDKMNVDNVQGDFMTFQAVDNKFCGDTDRSLNTNVVVENSDFNNAGYHGITFEAANGVMIKNNNFSNINVDSMDAEYDIYSTKFVNGQPTVAADDNITVTNNTWTNCRDVWFASVQGQKPGVQEQNIVLTNNTIKGDAQMLHVSGTDPTETTPQYINNGFIFSNNTMVDGVAHSTTGGSITTPFAGSTMVLKKITNVTIANNHIPLGDGKPGYYNNHPFLAVLKAENITGLSIHDNNFSGALGILNPNSVANTGVVECNNAYGVNGANLDAACATHGNVSGTAPGTQSSQSTSSSSGSSSSTTTAPATSSSAATIQAPSTQAPPAAPATTTGKGNLIQRVVPALSGGNPAVAQIESQELTAWYQRYWNDALLLIVILGLGDITWLYARRHRPHRDLSSSHLFRRTKYVNQHTDQDSKK